MDEIDLRSAQTDVRKSIAMRTDSPGQTSTVSLSPRSVAQAAARVDRERRQLVRDWSRARRTRNWNPCRCIACGALVW